MPTTRNDREKLFIISVDSSGNFKCEEKIAGISWNEEDQILKDWVIKKGIVGKTYQGMRARTRQYAMKTVTVKKVVPVSE